jgi:hypothetical protein
MATVFGFDSLYLDHSETYNTIVMICRVNITYPACHSFGSAYQSIVAL